MIYVILTYLQQDKQYSEKDYRNKTYSKRCNISFDQLSFKLHYSFNQKSPLRLGTQTDRQSDRKIGRQTDGQTGGYRENSSTIDAVVMLLSCRRSAHRCSELVCLLLTLSAALWCATRRGTLRRIGGLCAWGCCPSGRCTWTLETVQDFLIMLGIKPHYEKNLHCKCLQTNDR